MSPTLVAVRVTRADHDPITGSFNAYATRFFSPSYGFALSWNYWFNDAVSVASDLTAAQLVLAFWTDNYTWLASLFFWVFLVGVNAIHVRAYGELGMYICRLQGIERCSHDSF